MTGAFALLSRAADFIPASYTARKNAIRAVSGSAFPSRQSRQETSLDRLEVRVVFVGRPVRQEFVCCFLDAACRLSLSSRPRREPIRMILRSLCRHGFGVDAYWAFSSI